jgi:hypothetical protein
MSGDQFIQAANRLAEILGDACLLIGGLAVSAWGHVRATNDIDFVCRLEPDDIQAKLAAHGISTELKKGDIFEGDIPWVVHGTLSEIPFQILPPLVDVEWDRALIVALPDGIELRVVDFMDLIQLKLRAGGVRDLWDVAMLIQQHPETREEIRELAKSRHLLEDLDRWLEDPRLQD